MNQAGSENKCSKRFSNECILNNYNFDDVSTDQNSICENGKQSGWSVCGKHSCHVGTVSNTEHVVEVAEVTQQQQQTGTNNSSCHQSLLQKAWIYLQSVITTHMSECPRCNPKPPPSPCVESSSKSSTVSFLSPKPSPSPSQSLSRLSCQSSCLSCMTSCHRGRSSCPGLFSPCRNARPSCPRPCSPCPRAFSPCPRPTPSCPNVKPPSPKAKRTHPNPNGKPTSSDANRNYPKPTAKPTSSDDKRNYSKPTARPTSSDDKRNYPKPTARPTSSDAKRTYPIPNAAPTSSDVKVTRPHAKPTSADFKPTRPHAKPTFADSKPTCRYAKPSCINAKCPNPKCPNTKPSCPIPQPLCPHTKSPCSNAKCPSAESSCPSPQSPCPHAKSPCSNTKCPSAESSCPSPQAPCPHAKPPCPNAKCPSAESSCPSPQSPCPHAKPPCPNAKFPSAESSCPNLQRSCPHAKPPCTNAKPSCPSLQPSCLKAKLSNTNLQPPSPCATPTNRPNSKTSIYHSFSQDSLTSICKESLVEMTKIYLQKITSDHKLTCRLCSKRPTCCANSKETLISYLRSLLNQAWSYLNTRTEENTAQPQRELSNYSDTSSSLIISESPTSSKSKCCCIVRSQPKSPETQSYQSVCCPKPVICPSCLKPAPCAKPATCPKLNEGEGTTSPAQRSEEVGTHEHKSCYTPCCMHNSQGVQPSYIMSDKSCWSPQTSVNPITNRLRQIKTPQSVEELKASITGLTCLNKSSGNMLGCEIMDFCSNIKYSKPCAQDLKVSKDSISSTNIPPSKLGSSLTMEQKKHKFGYRPKECKHSKESLDNCEETMTPCNDLEEQTCKEEASYPSSGGCAKSDEALLDKDFGSKPREQVHSKEKICKSGCHSVNCVDSNHPDRKDCNAPEKDAHGKDYCNYRYYY